MPTHKHDCVRCDHRWNCLMVKCQVTKAAKANKSGPFCALCLHLVMAKRLIAQRGITAAGFMALVGDLTDIE